MLAKAVPWGGAVLANNVLCLLIVTIYRHARLGVKKSPVSGFLTDP